MTVTTILPRLPFAKGFKALLEEATGKPVGWRRIPTVPADDDPDTQVPVKRVYLIMYPLWTRTDGPPFGAPDADAHWTFQVSIYAERGDQLEVFRDKVIAAVLGRDGTTTAFVHSLDVDATEDRVGQHCWGRTMTEDSGGPTGPPTMGADELGVEQDLPSTDLRFVFDVSPRDP